MSRNIYNGERYERSKIRWGIFTVVVLILVLLSLFFPGSNRVLGDQRALWMDIANSLVILLLAGGYVWWIHNHDVAVVQSTIQEDALYLGERKIYLASIKGFFVELDKEGVYSKNLIIVFDESKYEVFSFLQGSEDYNGLIQALLDRDVPYISSFHQSFLQLLARKLKL